MLTDGQVDTLELDIGRKLSFDTFYDAVHTMVSKPQGIPSVPSIAQQLQ